ncbi:unnamed protein product, partial [Scytosiphon promiscuus]
TRDSGKASFISLFEVSLRFVIMFLSLFNISNALSAPTPFPSFPSRQCSPTHPQQQAQRSGFSGVRAPPCADRHQRSLLPLRAIGTAVIGVPATLFPHTHVCVCRLAQPPFPLSTSFLFWSRGSPPSSS